MRWTYIHTYIHTYMQLPIHGLLSMIQCLVLVLSAIIITPYRLVKHVLCVVVVVYVVCTQSQILGYWYHNTSAAARFNFLVSKDTNNLDLLLQATYYNHVGECSPPPDQSDCSIHYNNYDLMNIQTWRCFDKQTASAATTASPAAVWQLPRTVHFNGRRIVQTERREWCIQRSF